MSVYQKRHYEDVAKLLDSYCGLDYSHDEEGNHKLPLVRSPINITVRHIMLDFADLFAADNPKFDRGRFLRACGLEEK